ncbi:DNRLRE domain-containing protein [Peribacillus acanthi]|uniref:DNRLRE domain-containing protein n=1 Tax=Peribacillus acanthi TaxID=2171554 RepID=UPI001F0C6F10|nr:DNRLRE domain-containing protein [Peribacillus acanthi]
MQKLLKAKQKEPLKNKKQTVTVDIGELPKKLPKQKIELESKRTQYSKRFLNPDGSFTEEIFLEPQYYQDSNDKKWKKINNRLKKDEKNPTKHVNEANEVITTFANEINEEEVVTIENDKKSISLIPVNAKKVKGNVKNNEITYTGIYDNIDLRYKVKGLAVKEDIILNSLPSTNVFSFKLKAKGVTAVTQKDGTIVFKDQKGNLKWYLEKPYMIDSNNQYSDKVTLKLRNENGSTFVDVIADQEFLNDSNTKYPVTIDPTINEWDVIRDSFIASNYPSSAFSSETFMNTGYHGYFGSTRSLIQFYLPSLPSDSVITDASLNLFQAKSDTSTASIDIFRVNSSWTGASATWNTPPTIGGTPETTTTDNKVNDYWQWDITKLAKDWYNGIQANHGMMLKQQNEGTSPYRSFNSVNSGNNTPRLTVNYRVEAIGKESFWTNTEDSVNPANGNLVYQESDVEIQGRGPVVSLTRTFNSRKSSYKGLFGYGWITNLEPLIVDSGSGPITLIDEDNTRHIFGEKVGGGYEAAGGIYLDLVKNIDGTYTITGNDGTKTNFNSNGKISSIVDTNDNTSTYVYDTSGKLTKVRDASGRETTVNYGTNGYVSSVTDPAGRVTSYAYDASSNLTKVTDPEGKLTTFTYDADHNITGITDARNIKTTIDYDTSDRISTISRPITIDGVQQTSTSVYAYDTTNLVTSVTDGEGRRVDYTYNANGNVVQVTENPLDAANKAISSYTYDNNNNLTEVKDANTNKANGTATWVYTYDKNGNVTSVKTPENQTASYTYDSQNNLVKEQDFNNNVSTSDYDTNNKNIESTDANVQTSASRHDSNGNVKYDTHPMSAADNLIANSSYEIDQDSNNWPDNWVQEKDKDSTATYSWSNTSKFGGKSVSISNPSSWALVRTDTFNYKEGEKYIVSGFVKTDNTTGTALLKFEFLNDQNEKKGEAAYSSELKGTHDWTRLQSVIDNVPPGTTKISVAAGVNAGTGTAYFDGIQVEKGTTLSAFNLVENSSFERNAGTSDKLPFGWTNSSNLSANDGIYQNATGEDNVYVGSYSLKLTGEKTKNKYIKQRINLSGDATTPLTLSGWSKQLGADYNGGSYVVQVQINYTDLSVGTFANVFSKTTEDWQHVAAQVKPTKAFNSVDVLYLYNDQLGTAWFDAMRLEKGASHTFNTYDAGGNYLTEVDNTVGNNVKFSYDAVGNNTSVTDGKGKTTSFAYDKRNLLTSVTDAHLKTTSYGYDAFGNRTTLTDAKNNVNTYEYNEFNQVSKIKNPLNQVIQMGYDKNGNTKKLIFPKGDSVSYTYNALNRMDGIYHNGIKQWGLGYDANGNISWYADNTGKTTSFTYDKNNRVTQQAVGASNRINYAYDNNGNPTSLTVISGATTITNGYSYNSLNEMTAVTRDGVNQAKFIYDERGNVISTKKGNGTYTAFEYDDADRLKSLKNYNVAGALLYTYTYSYDANNNQTSVITSAGTASYQYDALNQLTQETLVDGSTISYEYDAVGNRTKKVVIKSGNTTTTNYTYDAANQLTAVNGQAYTYDPNGNLTNNGAKTFIYDVENRLIEVKNSAGTSLASFTYDKDGKRLSMTTASGTINYHYSEDKVIYETDANNNIVASYTWDAQGNPVSMTKNGVTYYYHVNGHGDVTALTDTNSVTVAQYQYDAWGNITSQTGTMASSNPYRYAGYRYDEITGLYYLMARYYDPNTARFITRDNFHGYDDEPTSLNQYLYTQSDPVNYIDPDGDRRLRIPTNSKPILRSPSPKQLKRGKDYEAMVLEELGLKKNKSSKIGSSIPDALTSKTIYEIKDAISVYKNSQFRNYERNRGKRKIVLIVSHRNVYISRPVKEVIKDSGGYIRKRTIDGRYVNISL